MDIFYTCLLIYLLSGFIHERIGIWCYNNIDSWKREFNNDQYRTNLALKVIPWVPIFNSWVVLKFTWGLIKNRFSLKRLKEKNNK